MSPSRVWGLPRERAAELGWGPSPQSLLPLPDLKPSTSEDSGRYTPVQDPGRPSRAGIPQLRLAGQVQPHGATGQECWMGLWHPGWVLNAPLRHRASGAGPAWRGCCPRPGKTTAGLLLRWAPGAPSCNPACLQAQLPWGRLTPRQSTDCRLGSPLS